MGRDRRKRLTGAMLVLTLLVLELPFQAHAGKPAASKPERMGGGLYKWKDDKGRWHYSETLPQEQEYETLELNRHGRVVRELDLTRDPLKQKSAKERAEREKAEKQTALLRQRDDALLRTYTHEREIDEARERNIALPEQAIRGLEKRLSQAEASLQVLRKQGQEHEKNGEPIPAGLTEEIAADTDDIERIQRDIERYRKQIISIRDRYDDDKRRFRELKGASPDAASTAVPAVQ